MKTEQKTIQRREAIIHFDAIFGVLEAIALPGRIRQLLPNVAVTLNFNGGRWLRQAAVATPIPTLASLSERCVSFRGLDAGELGWGALLRTTA